MRFVTCELLGKLSSQVSARFSSSTRARLLDGDVLKVVRTALLIVVFVGDDHVALEVLRAHTIKYVAGQPGLFR